jgi:hypothetical protein
MPLTHLHIELSGPDFLDLKFKILDSAIAELWVERMNARAPYPLDHPTRFYGFDDPETEHQRAQQMLFDCVQTINSHDAIIERDAGSAIDQDYLNYLHNIFERYHGLLDQQTSDFWKSAPAEVRKALAELNLAVHRCESLVHASSPRLVCTWFGLPKTHTLSTDLMAQYGTLRTEFGTVYLNYAEIGKTLQDLTQDQDVYIADDAFKPFSHYSADFVVRFFDEAEATVTSKLAAMHDYYSQHIDWFQSRGFSTFEDIRLQPLSFPVARLVETMPRDQLISAIAARQFITQVYFS